MYGKWPLPGHHDGRLRDHVDQPPPVAGLQVVAGDDKVRHSGGAYCRQCGPDDASEFAGGPIEELAPVAQDEFLPRPATCPHKILSGIGQQLDLLDGRNRTRKVIEQKEGVNWPLSVADWAVLTYEEVLSNGPFAGQDLAIWLLGR